MSCTCDSFQTIVNSKWQCANCGAEGQSPFIAYDEQYEWVQGFPVKLGYNKCQCGAHKTVNINCHSFWCPMYKKE